MANGPRTVRQSGFKRSSGLDNLMQVLQMGSGIAQSVQQSRNRRDSTQTSYLTALTQGFESNYSSQSIANMRNKIAEYKKNNLNNMSADAMDMFEIAEMRLKEHSENLNHYDTMIGNIDALPNQAYDLVGQLAQHGSLETQADKDAYAQDNWEGKTRKEKEDELIGVYKSYGTNMRDFFGRHGERISRSNPYLRNKYLELENVLLSSVSALDDGTISPNEQKFLKENLITPNPLKIEEWNNRNKKEIAWMDEKNRDQIYKMGEQYNHYDTILRSGFYILEGDDITEGDTFKVGSESEIRNYYARQGLEGDDLENKVAEARTYTKELQSQRAFYLGEANRYNTAYKKKNEIDVLEGLGITVPDYSTTTTTTTTTTTDEDIKEPLVEPQSKGASDIVGKKVDVNQEPLSNVAIPEYAEKRKNDMTQNLNTFTNLANNATYGKNIYKTETQKNIINELLKYAPPLDPNTYARKGRKLKVHGDTYLINQALGKEGSEILWKRPGGSRVRGYDYTDDIYQAGDREPSKFNNQAVTKDEVNSLMETFDKETAQYEDIMSQINLMEESFPEMNLRRAKKIKERVGGFASKTDYLHFLPIRDDGIPMPEDFINAYYELIEKRDAYRKKWYGDSMDTRYHKAGKRFGTMGTQNLHGQLKKAWNYFNVTIPEAINKKKEKVNSFIEKQGQIQQKRSN